MKNKGVDDINFWKKRFELKDRPKHYSVFIAPPKIWNDINDKHKKILEKEIKPTDRVIDLGCGYGRSSEMVKCKEYVGVDFSPDFIEDARKNYPDKTFINCELQNLPFENKSFDVGFMVSVKAMIISNLGEDVWTPMQKECERVCKKLLILEYGTGDLGIETNADVYEKIT